MWHGLWMRWLCMTCLPVGKRQNNDCHPKFDHGYQWHKHRKYITIHVECLYFKTNIRYYFWKHFAILMIYEPLIVLSFITPNNLVLHHKSPWHRLLAFRNSGLNSFTISLTWRTGTIITFFTTDVNDVRCVRDGFLHVHRLMLVQRHIFVMCAIQQMNVSHSCIEPHRVMW